MRPAAPRGALRRKRQGGEPNPFLSPPAQWLGQVGQAEQAEQVERGVEAVGVEGTTTRPHATVQGCRRPRGLFGGGRGRGGRALLLSLFALRPRAENSIPSAVQLILMKYCRHC